MKLVWVVGAAFIIAMIAVIVYIAIRNNKIKQNGVEADAVVTRIKTTENTDSDGCVTYSHEYFVTYTNQEGASAEAKLSNPPRKLTQGTHVKIKYLPEKPKIVVAVKE